MIQDIEPKHLYNEWKKNAVPKKSSAVVQFRGQDLLCRIDDNGLKFPSRSQFTEPDEAFTYLFELDGREYYLLFDENERVLDGYSYRNIGRGTFARGTATRATAAAAEKSSSTT